MRKLLLLGAAALLAFKGGKSLTTAAGGGAGAAAGRGLAARSRLGLSDILSMWFAPAWLRPFMLARAISARSNPAARRRAPR